MSDSKSKPPAAGPRTALDALLAGDAGDPVRRALWLDALDHLLRPHLPPALAAHARLANVDGTRLVFLVDSPVWHAKLRLATPALLEAARSVGLETGEIAIRTASHPWTASARPRSTVVPMSAAASEGLRAALASLRDPDDGNGSDVS
jgi:hypothetical protein